MTHKALALLVCSLFAAGIHVTACAGDDGRNGDTDADSDSDSDGDVDTETDTYDSFECDCDIQGMSAPLQLSSAITVCPGIETYNLEIASSSPQGDLGISVVEGFASTQCLVPRHGCSMIALSTGPVGQANPNEAESMGGVEGDITLDPIPEYQGSSPTEGGNQKTCDLNQLRFHLTPPAGMKGFSFEFLFASSEYDEYINQGYNDTFYAIIEAPSVNGGATTNIVFDDNNNEIEVDSNFFENSAHPCNEGDTGWSPETEGVSGSTGWLRTSWPIEEEEPFYLTFSIHDEGDCIYDSIALIDNFQWSAVPVSPGTVPIE